MTITTTTLLVIVAILFIVLPFVPGLVVLRRKKDVDALSIDPEKSFSPFATGNKFKEWVNELDEDFDIDKFQDLTYGNAVIISYDSTPLVVEFSDDMNCPNEQTFTSRIMVKGKANIGECVKLLSLFSHGNVSLGKGTTIGNWLDCRGNKIVAADNTNLGHTCVCKGIIKLGYGVCFERLYGTSICTTGKMTPCDIEYDVQEEGDIISSKKVVVKEKQKIIGNVVSKKDIVLEDNTFVTGGIFSDGNILIGKNCIVEGNIFSQCSVYVDNNTSIGKENHTKSMVAREEIVLANQVKVFGHILCAKGTTK